MQNGNDQDVAGRQHVAQRVGSKKNGSGSGSGDSIPLAGVEAGADPSRTQSERADSMDAEGSLYDEASKTGGAAGPTNQTRRDQNRIAQREFRARKQQHIKDLEARIALLSGDQDERSELMTFIVRHILAENAQLRRTVKQLAAFIGEGLATSLPRIGLTLDSLDAFVNRPESETAHEALEALKAAKARQPPPPSVSVNGPPKPNSIFDFLPSSKPQHQHGGRQQGAEGSTTGGKRKRGSTSNTAGGFGDEDDGAVGGGTGSNRSARAGSLGASTTKSGGQKRKSSLAAARMSAPGSPIAALRDSPQGDATMPIPLHASFMEELRAVGDGDEEDDGSVMMDMYGRILPQRRGAPQPYVQHSTSSSISTSSGAPVTRRATVPVPAQEQQQRPPLPAPLPPLPPQSIRDQERAYLSAFSLPEFGIALDRPDLRSYPSDSGPSQMAAVGASGSRDVQPPDTSPGSHARMLLDACGGRDVIDRLETAKEQEIAHRLLDRALTTMTGRQAEAFQLITYHMENWRQNPNYRLPPSLQPTTVQQHLPHETVIDGIIFPSLRVKMILLRGKYDLLQAMTSFMTGFLVRGEDTLDHNSWEVTEECLRENVMLLDAEVLMITNKWREQRGERLLERHDLLDKPHY